jgi:acetolactate synthase-1/2/3 large subunit
MESDAVPIRPERVFAEIGKVLNRETIVATDAGYASAWAVDLLELEGAGRRLITPRGYGSLGWGLPAAIGAKAAAPDRPVICITGDGGFAYVFQELETAARYGIAITTVVLNNSCLGFQKHYEEQIFHYPGDSAFLDVDHAMLARSMHCSGVRVSNPDDLGDALRDAVGAEKPTVIDVVTDPDALPAVMMFERT